MALTGTRETSESVSKLGFLHTSTTRVADWLNIKEEAVFINSRYTSSNIQR